MLMSSGALKPSQIRYTLKIINILSYEILYTHLISIVICTSAITSVTNDTVFKILLYQSSVCHNIFCGTSATDPLIQPQQAHRSDITEF